MDQDRIARIAALGDGLAAYVRQQGGKRFFRSFFTEQNPAYFRTLLIKANMAHIRAGQPALFDMGMYIDVFEEGYEVMRPDWRLARDLVLMRMIDQLKDWLACTPDALPADEIEADVVDATA
jgi:CRISPR-associated protein Cst1